MTEPSSPGPRYTSLRDYLGVLRRYWPLILLVTLVGAGAGVADALRQSPVYQAKAQVGFQDPTKDLNLVGLGSNSTETPASVAAVNATTATSPSVMTQVQRQLEARPQPRSHSTRRQRRHGRHPANRPRRSPAASASPPKLSLQALTGEISTQVEIGPSLLQITASAATPQFAARLANTVANVVVAQNNQQTRAQFARLAANLQRKVAHLKSPPGGGLTPQQSFYDDELARLDTLASFATSAQLADPAQVPSGPSSPHKTREAVIGGLLGLLLGLIAAFVRDSMDRRLRKPGDFESAFGLPVIGNVRKQSLGKVAYAPNGTGAIDQLDLEAFRILRRNVEFLDPERAPTLVLVTSALAEEGKTTVAGSLAFVLAAAGKRTLLVDCDLRRPDLAGRVGVELSPGLTEYLAGAAESDEIMRKITFSEPSVAANSKNGSTSPSHAEPGTAAGDPIRSPLVHEVTCVPAGTVTSRGSELLGTRRFQDFLEYATSQYDMVVLDSSPLLPVADTLEMLPHVDSVVICARQARTTREQARAARAALGRFPPRPTGVVVTGIKPRGAEYEVYAYSYSYS